MIDADGGDGIGGYTYELAEGLAANGVAVDVYANSRAPVLELPRHHRIFPVLGGALSRAHAPQMLQERPTAQVAEPVAPRVVTTPTRRPFKDALRHLGLPIELALHLRRTGHDLVWGQWPGDDYGAPLYHWCRWLGLRVVHTVHNVLPHEERADDLRTYGRVYRAADAVIVHSQAARAEMAALFPETRHKMVLSRIGLYSMYPPIPGARENSRRQWSITADQPVLLLFGGIRPYKNPDALFAALTDPAFEHVRLIVAGREAGYPDGLDGDPLGRTRRKVHELGIAGHVRLLPGRLSIAETSALFDAVDVLALPYVKGYGSASLLLGMTFGKHILATRTGGMDEYLEPYPRHTLLEGSDVHSLVNGLTESLARLNPGGAAGLTYRCRELAWPTIARTLLSQIAHSHSCE
jgi:glycosyltransferase involved in cell wall biosynthesis